MVQLKVYSNQFRIFAFFRLSVVSGCYLLTLLDTSCHTAAVPWVEISHRHIQVTASPVEQGREETLAEIWSQAGHRGPLHLGAKSVEEADSSH